EANWSRQLRYAKELQAQGDYQAARQVLIDIAESTGAAKLDDLAAAVVFNNLGAVTQKLGDLAAAGKWYRESLRRLDHAGDSGKPMRSSTLNNLAVLYGAQQ